MVQKLSLAAKESKATKAPASQDVLVAALRGVMGGGGCQGEVKVRASFPT